MSDLPQLLTTFIGRAAELADVRAAIQRSRLVTLVGTGGVGKTRLAIEAAQRLAEDEIDSVYFVDLAPLHEPERLEQTVVVALGGSQDPGNVSLETIVSLLAAPRSLLLIDNCEHLIEPVAHLVEGLLHGVPGLRLLATSREALDIAGEARYVVLPLSDEDGASLFIDRSSSLGHRMAPPNESKASILQLCRSLDGLPLAIELAAARVSQMPVGEILSRLDDRYGLLTKSPRIAVARHRTLQAAIAWSYDLLDPEERESFACLSVFAGEFDLAAAHAVAHCSLEVLGRLVDKSMVVGSTGAEGLARYRLLETLRQFARSRLEEGGQAVAAKRRHFEHFGRFAKQAAGELHGPDQVRWMDRLDEELANLRAALDWARANDPDGGLGMAVDLIWYWHHRDHEAEGRAWLKGLASMAPSPQPRTLASALTQAADFACTLGQRDVAMKELEPLLEVWRRLDDPAGMSRALVVRAYVASAGGIYADAADQLPMLEEAVREARNANQKHLLTESLTWLGQFEAFNGKADLADAHLREAEAIARQAGDVFRLGWILDQLGGLEVNQGLLDAADAHQTESLNLHLATRSAAFAVMAYVGLGHIRMAQNRNPEARRLFEAALTLEGASLPNPGGLEGLADLAAKQGFLQRALKLHGAALSATYTGIRRALEKVQWYGAAVGTVGQEAADAAWEAGAAMSTPEAVAYALSDADVPSTDDGPLTAREKEIAAWVARGLRNREIAQQLHISSRTVDAHAEHIRNKLGFQSRSQIAAWAQEHGLVKS